MSKRETMPYSLSSFNNIHIELLDINTCLVFLYVRYVNNDRAEGIITKCIDKIMVLLQYTCLFVEHVVLHIDTVSNIHLQVSVL